MESLIRVLLVMQDLKGWRVHVVTGHISYGPDTEPLEHSHVDDLNFKCT